MGTNLFENLPAVLQKHEAQLYKMVSLVVQKAGLAAGAYLGHETPVDTGVARSNWIMTIGQRFNGVIPAYVPYPTYRPNHHEAVKVAILNTVRQRKGGKFSPGMFKGKP